MNAVASDQRRAPQWTMLFICWLIALVSTLGSLFFSEVMGLPPCVLCWYQRIFMFPLAVTLTVGLLPFDLNSIKYSLPLAIGGWGVAFYHCLLYAGFIPESIQPCSQGVSCADAATQALGIVPIPLLSVIAFSTIIVLLIAVKRGIRK